jgi:exodeoxyribonuclease-3
VLGLWPAKPPGWPDYVPQIAQALDWVESLTDEEVVVAGDFNAPVPSSVRAYRRVAARYARLGLADAYRHARGLSDDEEPAEPTYFHEWKREKPFHIDRVLLPVSWVSGAAVEVGDFDTWVASKRSDHVPVVVELG